MDNTLSIANDGSTFLSSSSPTTSSSSRLSSREESVSFYNFLDRMRNPSSLDLVRAIKSFIVSFSFYTPNPENDSKRFQDFLLKMEAAIRDHPLWSGATEEEIDSALEGLEKYVITKLFTRTFALSSEDAKVDEEISEKIHLLQNFLKPEHLDIPAVFHDTSSWLLAEKELQNINAFRAPRDKLRCILNCCRVINDLLLNVSITENRVLGADDFLPILIYVTIQANPAKMHSNLKFIQLYRRQATLVSEAAYHFTNLVSAKSFILYLDAKSLSIDQTEFQESMHAARQRLATERVKAEPSISLNEIKTVQVPATIAYERERHTEFTMMLDEMITLAWSGPSGGTSFPFLEAEANELSVGDIERLLGAYKDVVNKYTRLCKAVRCFSMAKMEIRASTIGPLLPEGKSNRTKEQEHDDLCHNVQPSKEDQ